MAVLLVAMLLTSRHSEALSLFQGFGISQERELGRKFEVLVRSRMPLIEDPEVRLYVQSLVDRLAEKLPPQPFPFRSSVLLEKTMNAFAVPGGQVFVHTGLLMNLDRESELVGVLAHELAHVRQRHIAGHIERAQQMTVATLAGMLAGALLGGTAAGGALIAGSMAAGQSALLKYNRADEADADFLGFQNLIDAGFPADGMWRAFEKIRSRQRLYGRDIPEYLSSHPDITGRIGEIKARIQTQPESVRKRQDSPESVRNFNRAKTVLWARFGDRTSAEKIFSERLRQNANDASAVMGLAILAARSHEVRKADTLFAEAMKKDPHDELIIREYGRFLFETGDNRAGEMLKKALDMKSDDVMAQFFYARFLSETGQRDSAYPYFASLLKKLPDDAELHYIYGRSLGEGGKLFEGSLHIAYSGLYANDRRRAETWLKKAESLVLSSEQKQSIARFKKIYKERSAYWKNS
ncbi:MAG: M48 family metalloprotease [Desulfovibrionaceae bacterium]|nr:M48 family metalloprotease [Desulfovibrionaceae bacterium]